MSQTVASVRQPGPRLVARVPEEDELVDDLAKDTPPAAPAAPAAASGPTVSSVHVAAPLKRLSISYGRGRQQYEVHKADPQQQLAYGIVLEPSTVDSQRDWVPPEHVEQAAHRFLKKAVRGQATVHRLQHRAVGFHKAAGKGLCPVESFIAPVDFTYNGRDVIRKGSWVLVAHVEDPALWAKFLDGTYNGWSVGGTGVRQPMEKQQQPAGPMGVLERLADALTSLADRPAPTVSVTAPVTIADGAVQVQPPDVHVHVAAPDVHVDVAAPTVQVAAPEVHVAPAEVTFEKDAIRVEAPKRGPVRVETVADGSRRYVPE